MRLIGSTMAEILTSTKNSFLLLAIIGCSLMVADTAQATGGGSWGGSRGGLLGGGSGGLLRGGSWGGSRGGLRGMLAGRQPLRNLLGRVGSRLGSVGGSTGFGSTGSMGSTGSTGSAGSSGFSLAGSTGYSSGSTGYASGSTGYSIAASSYSSYSGSVGSMTSTAAQYGSWGSSYLNSTGVYGGYADSGYFDSGSSFISAPAYNETSFGVSDFGYSDPGYIDAGIPAYGGPVIGSEFPMDSGAGIPMDSGIGLPMDSGIGIPMGNIIDPESAAPMIMAPDVISPQGFPGGGLDGGLDSGTDPTSPPTPRPIEEDDGATFLDYRDSTMASIEPVEPESNHSVLSVVIPEEARVYINGRLTKTPGKRRDFVSRGLKKDKTYRYEIRAEIEVDGKKVSKTQVVRMDGGAARAVKFDFAQTLMTQVSLRVPKDAKVELCGNETTIKGEHRRFTTTELAAGQAWENYKVIVSVDRNGKRLSQEKTITVDAGESYDLAFDFAADSVASK